MVIITPQSYRVSRAGPSHRNVYCFRRAVEQSIQKDRKRIQRPQLATQIHRAQQSVRVADDSFAEGSGEKDSIKSCERSQQS